MDAAEFESLLGGIVEREIAGCTGLKSAERLSGGASQETYRLTLNTTDGERVICMRRAPGGGVEHNTEVRIAPGLATEAQLMACAREVGVPEPEVYYVLEDADGLGDRLAQRPQGADRGGPLRHVGVGEQGHDTRVGLHPAARDEGPNRRGAHGGVGVAVEARFERGVVESVGGVLQHGGPDLGLGTREQRGERERN